MKKNLQKYLNNGDLKPHRSSVKEIESFKKLIERDLKDCAIEELSVDRRFATAYQAALNNVSRIFARSDIDKAQFISLGAAEKKTEIVGSIKYAASMAAGAK